MKTLKLLLLSSIILLGVCCSNDHATFNTENEDPVFEVNKSLIGKWVQIPTHVDFDLEFTFTDNDTIYQAYSWEAPTLTYYYKIIAEDSIEVIRNWEVGEKYKHTKHQFIFHGSDTLELIQFLGVDYGITGFEDITLIRQN